MKRKQSTRIQPPRLVKAKLDGFFPIDTLIQNPGFELVARNIFKYLKLEDFSNCRLVSKTWKQFIDEDKYLGKVLLEEVKSLYSKKSSGFTAVSSAHVIKLFLDNCYI